MLFMIRYKRRYGMPWHYRPTVFEEREEPIRQAALSAKDTPGGKALYAVEVVQIVATPVYSTRNETDVL